MHSGQRAVVWFNEVTKQDLSNVGGKGANLGEITKARIPVPHGFIVTADAYFDFLRQTKLMDKIREPLEPIDVNDSKRLQQVAAQVKQVILNIPMPSELAGEIET